MKGRHSVAGRKKARYWRKAINHHEVWLKSRAEKMQKQAKKLADKAEQEALKRDGAERR